MNLFVFGLGYSVRQFLSLYRERFTEIGGTVRTPEKVRAMEAEGIQAFRFDGTDFDPRILERIARADALLVSVPPVSETDPVLNHFAEAIASAPHLRWLGYLSTVGVYGHADGYWVDETTAPNPATIRSRHRIAAEREWLALGESAPF